MLSGELSIDTYVCLKCGELIAPDKLEVKKIAGLDVPEDVKVSGKLFSTFVCPKCDSVFIGFLAVAKKSTKTYRKDEQDIIDIPEDDEIVLPTKKKKIGQDDDIIDVNAPRKKNKPNRKKPKKVNCTSCNAVIDVGIDFDATFGTKCNKCMKSLGRSSK